MAMTPSAASGTRTPRARWDTVRGALLLAFGLSEGALILLAFRVPHITASLLVLVMAGFVVAAGAGALLGAARTPDGRGWLLAHGLTGVAAGVLMVLLAPGWSVRIFALWAIVTGVLDAVEPPAGGRARVVVAVLSLALGVVVLTGILTDPVRVLLAISAYGVVAGGLWLRAGRPGAR